MQSRFFAVLAATTLASSAALADTYTVTDSNNNADSSGVVVRSAENMEGGYLRNEVVGIKPQAGVITFKDAAGSDSSRLALGLTLDMNMTRVVTTSPNLYFGPSTGLIYSHLGSAGSNFFGTDSSTTAGTGANFFYIPANVKLGWNMGRDFRVSVHGGGNVIYRSVANAINLGNGSNSADALWKIYPNAGADLEIGLGQNAAILLRPDLTITPANDVFTATLGFAAPLG